MTSFFSRLWQETDGVLSFEWTMLTSLLTVGVVSGMAAVRDAATDEMGDLAQAMVSLDQSYMIQPPLVIRVHSAGAVGGGLGSLGGSSASDSAFVDRASYREFASGSMKVNEFPPRGDRQSDGLPPQAIPMPAPEETAPTL
jgi:Flp pilus assembly pilin Flp